MPFGIFIWKEIFYLTANDCYIGAKVLGKKGKMVGREVLVASQKRLENFGARAPPLQVSDLKYGSSASPHVCTLIIERYLNRVSASIYDLCFCLVSVILNCFTGYVIFIDLNSIFIIGFQFSDLNMLVI